MNIEDYREFCLSLGEDARRFTKEIDRELLWDSQGEIYEEMIRDFIAIDFETANQQPFAA